MMQTPLSIIGGDGGASTDETLTLTPPSLLDYARV